MPFIKEHQPDILCLQETKAMEGECPLDLPDYEEYWHSAEKKGYSGTAIFTKIEPIEATLGLPGDIVEQHKLTDKYGDSSKEGRITTLEFENYYVSSVYTPNAKDDLTRLPVRQEWDQAYLTYMKRLQSKKPVIFAGDLNVAHKELDLARPKENEGKKGFTKEERFGIDAMLGSDFVDSFRQFHKDEREQYTWWSQRGGARVRNVGWRIDYVMVSKDLVPILKRADIHADVMGSDHCPVSVQLSI